MQQLEPAYRFAGQQLPPNRIRPLDLICDQCSQRIWRTKTAVDVGAGMRMVALACHCISFSVTRGYADRINSRVWRWLVTGEKLPPESTSN
jgi:hypothetical protein